MMFYLNFQNVKELFFRTFVADICTMQIYKHFKQNKQLCLKLLIYVVIFIQSK